jgi:hypothetical protein
MEASMTRAGQIGLAVMVAGVVLIGTIAVALFSACPQATTPYQVVAPEEVHIRAGAPVVLNDPDPAKLYVVDAGGKLSVTRPQGNPNRMKRLSLLVTRGGELTMAEGTNIYVMAEPGSRATVSDGVSINAQGVVHAKGTAQVKALAGSVIYNSGFGDELAYDGSTTYAMMRGRVFAFKGALVYAKSPEGCDACTQVEAHPGSTVYVYEGAEAFATQATVTVYKGGEVGCYHDCVLYIFPESEYFKCPGCAMNMMAADAPVVPFKEEEE